MASTSSGHHPAHDLESQQILPLIAERPQRTDRSPRALWQQILPLIAKKSARGRWQSLRLIFQAYSIILTATEKKASASHSRVTSSSSSYGTINTTAAIYGDVDSLPLEILAGNPCEDGNMGPAKLQYAKISEIIKAKDLTSLNEFGGVKGIADALDSDLINGIPDDEDNLCCRQKATAHHTIQIPRQGFLLLLLKAGNNYTILLLLFSASLSIGFGIRQEGMSTGWCEGVLIITAVIILVLVPGIRDYFLERCSKFSGKNKREEIMINVIRAGCHKNIPMSNVLLGDVLCIKTGDQLPADGLYISGENLVLDDCSEATIDSRKPFLYYGAEVVSGNCCMLVTSVGTNKLGEMMKEVTPFNKTPMQVQLDKVNSGTQIAGLLTSILILVVLFLRVELGGEQEESGQQDLKGKPTAIYDLMTVIKRVVMKPNGKISMLTVSLTMLLIAITEGLPVVVTLAVIYWNKKTLCDNANAQELPACITMGSVTTICIEPSGGLSLNPYEVDTCIIGQTVQADRYILASHVRQALCDGVSKPVLLPYAPCTLIDTSLLSWAELKLGMERNNENQRDNNIMEIKRIFSSRKKSGMLMKKSGTSEPMCSHWKGQATAILSMCSFYYDSEGNVLTLDQTVRVAFQRNIIDMESKNLRAIALAYKSSACPRLEKADLVLLGIVGLKSKCSEEIMETMEACKKADIRVVLVSGDDVLDLEDIAHECGILPSIHTSQGIDSQSLQDSSYEERMDMVDKISVMGSASPEGKLLLVKCLKQKGHTVAVIGFRTEDIPAMKEADVGLTTGEWSTNLVKKSSDIIINNGSFSSLITILESGRCIYDNIQKYIQLELTMVVAGLLIPSIITICTGKSPISAIQLSWAYGIAAIPGGLAILTESPNSRLLDKPAVIRAKPLINKAMWRNITIQVVNQVVILLTVQFKGQDILSINEKETTTMVFTGLVVCQVFNQLSSRALDDKYLLKGMLRNKWFWVAASFTITLQVAFIEIAHAAVGDARLTLAQWCICGVIGLVSCAANFAGRFLLSLLTAWLIKPIIMYTRTRNQQSYFEF